VPGRAPNLNMLTKVCFKQGCGSNYNGPSIIKKVKLTFWNTCSFFFIFLEFPVPGTEMNGNLNLFIVTVTKDENFTKKIQYDSL
jgi:hypothetical protein